MKRHRVFMVTSLFLPAVTAIFAVSGKVKIDDTRFINYEVNLKKTRHKIIL